MKKLKKTKKKNKGFKIVIVLLFFSIFILIYSFSNKLLIDLGVSYYSGMLSTASYYALNSALDPSFEFGDYFKIEKNNNGDIVMINTDSYKFNLLANKIVIEVSNYFNEELSKGVDVPIGAFTGIRMLAGFGKKVKMPLVNVYSIRCDIVSSFQDAGINQTKHSLYINIVPEVFIVTRFSTKHLIDKISILIYENIIVGDIPSTYLEGSIISSEKTL